jgi:hypothetical protein
MTGRVTYLSWITRDMLQADPEARFVFGDNAERWGLGGQAKEMRGEPNAIGVATLWSPGSFYAAGDINSVRVVIRDLHQVGVALVEGRKVIVPTDGLGTGLARLAENAPAIANLITAFFHACPGDACPWEFI